MVENVRKLFAINEGIEFYLKALTLLFTISITFGFITAQQFPSEANMAMDQAVKELEFIKGLSQTSIFLLIALNNSVKVFLMMLLGVLWGVIPVIFILLNGYAAGIISSVVLQKSGLAPIVLGTLPHGVFEISAVLLAASYGVWLGERFVKKLKAGEPLGAYVKIAAGYFFRVLFPLLVLAALIETFISDRIISAFIL